MHHGRRLLALLLTTGLAGGCGDDRTDAEPASAPVPRATAEVEVPAAEREANRPKRNREPGAEPKPEPEVAPVPPPVATPEYDPGAVPEPQTSEEGLSPGAPSDAEIRQELRQALKLADGGPDSDPGVVRSASLSPRGLASPPPGAPPAVQAIVAGGNQVAHAPYVYGGGHGRWVDSGYDCSGSISFALASAGLTRSPMDSSTLARWGEPGPGKWVTIYANAGHAYMVVAGLRFDTSGRASDSSSRWQADDRSRSGYVVRHPRGL